MLKRFALVAIATLFVGAISVAAQAGQASGSSSDTAKSTPKTAAKSWTGWITDDHCGAKGATADHAACAKKCVDTQGAKYVLYSTSTKKTYNLDDQTAAAAHAAHQVVVHGTIAGDTIHVTSITMPTVKKTAAKTSS